MQLPSSNLSKHGSLHNMKVLLDTNIVIHREGNRISNQEIGILFNWLDRLGYEKYVHPVTVQEINRHKQSTVRDIFNIKLEAYNILSTQAPLHSDVEAVSNDLDSSDNDTNDTILLNEVYVERVDYLITEDRKIGRKARELKISDRVFTIDSFLEKVVAENPPLANYKVLSVKKELFGNLNVDDPFFDSFKEDYNGFTKWFNKKSEQIAYVCSSDEGVAAFLYLKVEDKNELYSDINPTFQPKRRLKIGTFKVTLNGYKLGERFIKIIFDNALRFRVEEIYVTLFNTRVGQQRLIGLLEDFGFKYHGTKGGDNKELVYVRKLQRKVNLDNPRQTYPLCPTNTRFFLNPIYPEYHTNLFPDSILNNESPKDFVENKPFRNAIRKVYISRSYVRNLKAGDVIIFYRTGGYHKSVISTIGIVEDVITDIKDSEHFISLCRKRSVFTDNELVKHWDYGSSRPFVVKFLYCYSFPKRLNMKRLIEIGVIANVQSAPRGFTEISRELFRKIIEETKSDKSFVVD